eukprot:309963_1
MNSNFLEIWCLFICLLTFLCDGCWCFSISMTIKETGTARLQKYLQDCKLLGPCRFILSQKRGESVLEAVGTYDRVSIREAEGSQFLTLSDDDDIFEAHLKVGSIKKVVMLSKTDKSNHEMFITRFLGENDEGLLSMMLHRDTQTGEYEDGSVAYWRQLQEAFGKEQIL